MRAANISVCLGPNVDVMRDPLGGRNYEMYGEDPVLVGRTAAAFIRGLQSTGVMACAKHFIANNQETNRQTKDTHVSIRTLRELYAKGFRAAVKVGMWDGMSSTLGTAIRPSCQDPSDREDAYVMGAALPINDMYGDKEQMYKEPDALYQDGLLGTPVVLTEKAEGKDLEALFTYFDWTYTFEGAKTIMIGLNEEQYASVTLDPNLFAANGITTTYTESEGEDGKLVIEATFNSSDTIETAMMSLRMGIGLRLDGTEEYTIERGYPMVNQKAIEQWRKYLNLNTGNILSYTSLLDAEETDVYNKANAACMEIQAKVIPEIIRGMTSWDEYVEEMEKVETEKATVALQKYVNLAKTTKD